MTETLAAPADDPLADVTPEETAALLALLRAERAGKAAAAAAAERQRATGYPRRLYNSQFPGESIFRPDSTHRLEFSKGVLDVQSADDEAYVRAACPNRIYAADMPEQTCDRCGLVCGSLLAWTQHLKSHVP